MSNPNQPGDLDEAGVREKRIWEAVELLARAAQVADKGWQREEILLNTLELLDPRMSRESTVRTLLTSQLKTVEEGSQLHELLVDVKDLLS